MNFEVLYITQQLARMNVTQKVREQITSCTLFNVSALDTGIDFKARFRRCKAKNGVTPIVRIGHPEKRAQNRNLKNPQEGK